MSDIVHPNPEARIMTTFAMTQTGYPAARANAERVIDFARSACANRNEEPAMTVIAMTSDTGSFGTEVATAVARRLGLKLVQSETIAASVAERLGIAQDIVTRHMNGTASMLERWRIDQRKLDGCVREKVLDMVQQGNVLVDGCAAAVLLRIMPQVLGVRVCTPGAVRSTLDDVEEPAGLYDLVLNAERMSVDACTQTVCKLARCPRFGNRVMTKSALASKLLEVKISRALTENISRSMAPLGIDVSVIDGTVTLAATTSSGALRAKAAGIARAIAGAAIIDNRIASVPSHGRLH